MLRQRVQRAWAMFGLFRKFSEQRKFARFSLRLPLNAKPSITHIPRSWVLRPRPIFVSDDFGRLSGAIAYSVGVGAADDGGRALRPLAPLPFAFAAAARWPRPSSFAKADRASE